MTKGVNVYATPAATRPQGCRPSCFARKKTPVPAKKNRLPIQNRCPTHIGMCSWATIQ
jgi:hypothetical protein